VRGIDRLVVLAEELLALSFGKVSEDHQRIGGSSVGCVVTGLSLRSPVAFGLPAARARTLAFQDQPAPRVQEDHSGVTGGAAYVRVRAQFQRAELRAVPSYLYGNSG